MKAPKLTVTFTENLNGFMPFVVQGLLLTQPLVCSQRISSSSQDKKTQFSTKQATMRAEDARAVLLNRWATSLRQLSKCGMRMTQGQFPRLKNDFQLEEFGEQKVVLCLMV